LQPDDAGRPAFGVWREQSVQRAVVLVVGMLSRAADRFLRFGYQEPPGMITSRAPAGKDQQGATQPMMQAANTLGGWLALLLAGCWRIAWALGLKYSDGLTRFWPSVAMIAAIALSFGLLAIALKSVPFGTAYALWTGIGAAGTA
jgi:hypothetical protein